MTISGMERLPPSLHEATRKWFSSHFDAPTAVQVGTWEACARQEHALVVAPTGSGKTLAAFLWFLDRMYRQALEGFAVGDPGPAAGGPAEQVARGGGPVVGSRGPVARGGGQVAGGGSPVARGCRLLYLSPLKALGTDIKNNLEGPLAGLRTAFAAWAGCSEESIRAPRVLTRSGDTDSSARQAMLRNPPDILVTTPESLNIMLCSRGGRSMLGSVEGVIVDELHYLLEDKRGSLLAANLERLADCAGEFRRLGVSATVEPQELAAAFLGGFDHEGHPRPVTVVAPGGTRERRFAMYPLLSRESPDPWRPVARTIVERLGDKRSTIVFSNSRRGVERLAMLINEEAGDRIAWPHHGSLSREIRSAVETRLKAGELRVVVATSSLELGIDVGEVDEVVLVQAPFSLASVAQRLGRAGHGVGRVSAGAFFALHPWDLVQSMVAARGVEDGRIAPSRPHDCPLDVLPQVILGECAQAPRDRDSLLAMLRRAWPWRNLEPSALDGVLAMLAGAWNASGIQELSPRIRLEEMPDMADNPLVHARSGVEREIYASGGTIPDLGNFELRLEGSNMLVGSLDEEFVWERRRGERFLLGNQTWEVCRIEDHKVVVQPSTRAPQFYPFWRADPQGRDPVFNSLILDLLDAMPARPDKADLAPLVAPFLPQACPDEVRQGVTAFLAWQAGHTDAPLPCRKRLVIEHTRVDRNRSGFCYTVIHSFWGLRINTCLAFAMASLVRERNGSESMVEILPADNAILVYQPGQEGGSRDAGSGNVGGPGSRDAGSPAPGPQVPGRQGAAGLPDAASPLALLRELANRPRDLGRLVDASLGASALFGRVFRQGAGRALLISRGGMGKRLPLWLSRRKSRRLLESLADHPDFPILQEAWTEARTRHLDLDGLGDLLGGIRSGAVDLVETTTERPSPLAEGILFALGNMVIYESDKPGIQAASLPATSRDPAPPPPAPSSLEAWTRRMRRLEEGLCPPDSEALWYHVQERIAIGPDEWQDLSALCRRTWTAGTWPDPAGFPPGCEALARVVLEGASESLVVNPAHVPRFGTDTVSSWLSLGGPVTRERIRELWGRLGQEFLEGLPDTVVDLGPETGLMDADAYDGLMAWQRRQQRALVVARPLSDLALDLARHQGIRCQGRRHGHPEAAPDGGSTERGGASAADAPLTCSPEAGARPLADLVEAAAGLPLPSGDWEETWLPLRVSPLVPRALDAALAETGLAWTGAGKDSIRFMPLEGMAWPQAAHTRSGNGPAGREAPTASGPASAPPVDDAPFPWPDADGAWDFWTLQRKTGMESAALARALWTEVWQGRASNDDLSVLRVGIQTGFKPADATATGGQRRPPAFRQWQRSRPQGGRWFPLSPSDLPTDPLERHEAIESMIGLLFQRWPVLARDLVEREWGSRLWSTILPVLQRLELAGVIRGGMFYQGMSMPQFSPVDEVRVGQGTDEDDSLWFLCSQDPASTCGIDPGLPTRGSGAWCFWRGTRLLGTGSRGLKSIEPCGFPEAPGPGVPEAPGSHSHAGPGGLEDEKDCEDLAFLIHHCARLHMDRDLNPLSSVVIATIGNVPARTHPLGALLQKRGFQADGTRLRLWKY